MAGLFSGLEIGKKALATHQLWLNTIGHNVANVNTPGYTRQRVTITTTLPEPHRVGQVGSGVQAVDIRNVRDLFLNQQYRLENKNLGQWQAMEKTMTQIEAMFNEPNDDSLNDLMNEFWNSWDDLTQFGQTESASARIALIEKANLMTSGFHRLYSGLKDLQYSVNKDIEMMVEDVNSIAFEIAELNKKISREEVGGNNANDLRDRRDYLIDELSQFVDVNTLELKNGATMVQIGSMILVDEQRSISISTEPTTVNGVRVSELRWEKSDKVVTSLNGQLKGLVETRDEVLKQYMNDLDAMAKALVTQVNAVHQTGYGLQNTTGYSFFDSRFVSAEKISVAFDIQQDINLIAASGSGEVGDNTNALAIAALRDELLLNNGNATLSEYYNAMISRVGVETSKSIQFREDYQLLVEQIENSRQSVQGVSLDEEMAQMIKYQHAFDAAARVITTVDEALDMVINKMGLVGR